MICDRLIRVYIANDTNALTSDRVKRGGAEVLHSVIPHCCEIEDELNHSSLKLRIINIRTQTVHKG
jgi:hypothetical protein